MEQILNYKYSKGEKTIFPANPLVENWSFREEQEDEATLCNAIAKVAEKNGFSPTDMHHLFPAILRMLRSKIEWAQNETK
jgi:hypothetical protein